MRYFYEYKYKKGTKVGGHNLENIITRDNYIILKGVDIFPTYYDEEYHYWTQTLDMNEIEYLKIEPMGEVIVMNKEEIATTYEEYKNGAKQVAGLGRLSCYQGLDYLEKLLEKDKYYSEKLEDSIVFIESHINRIEKENKKYKEVIDKVKEWVKNWTHGANDWFEENSKPSELLDILKEVE